MIPVTVSNKIVFMGVRKDTLGKDVINVYQIDFRICILICMNSIDITSSFLSFQACTFGWFGFNCSVKCSDNCINQLCDNIYGNCTRGCLTGWMGHNCTKGKNDPNLPNAYDLFAMLINIYMHVMRNN